ncbi:MAG: DUF935 family protein [Muribaculaceae bacterium]|nr:DUF935 family protein [Muribaculaceae bacterium]
MAKKDSKYTPEMVKAMRTVAGREKLKSVMVELVNQTRRLTAKDMGDWRRAWQIAISHDNPKRNNLLDIYDDIMVDMHLTGCITQRTGFVTKKAFRLRDIKSGDEKQEITELFETEWFKKFVRLSLESLYYGHSLIQMGDVVKPQFGNMRFADVELINRYHVIPEYGVIVKDRGDEWQRGISFREGEYSNWCIEVGDPYSLGLLLKCAPPCISKKNMLAFWDSWGEMFGMPVRIGKTTSRDAEEIDKMERMLADMAAEAWGLFPEGTDIEFKETSRTDAYNVYDRRIDRANSEISKGILAQTMTIDSGSSLSQSEVHLEVFKNIIDSDADMIRDVVNSKLLPFMVAKGFPVQGCRFDWDDAVEFTPQEQINIEQMILNGGYEIDPKYFADKYNIPIIGKKENFFD